MATHGPERDPSIARTVMARALRLLRPAWYERRYGDVRRSGQGPLLHFESRGLGEDRDPCALFDAAWYRREVAPPANMPALVHYLTVGAAQGADPSPAFDSAWYVRLAGPIEDGETPLEHYLRVGATRQIDPHPLFRTSWYLGQHAVDDLEDLTAYEHFLELGWRRGFSPSPAFDVEAYLLVNSDVRERGAHPYLHFLTAGLVEGRPAPTLFGHVRSPEFPHPPIGDPSRLTIRDRALLLLRPESYLRRYEEVRLDGADAVTHFSLFGLSEGRDPCVLFDSEWYRKAVGRPLDRSVTPLEHYLGIGGFEGVDPSPVFDSAWYLRQVGELPASTTPLEHYIRVGAALAMDPHPLFSTVWYTERNGPLDLDGMTAYEHFLEIGWQKRLNPSPVFHVQSYLDLNDDVARSGKNPFVHYVADGIDEKRLTSTLFDAEQYTLAAAEDPLIRRFSALAHYVHFGQPIGRAPSLDPLAATILEHLVTTDRRARGSRSLVPHPSLAPPALMSVSDWPARAAELELTDPEQPRVSVILPTFNHSDDVIRCLESVAAAADMTSIEVILVDDASERAHQEVFEKVRGVRYVRLEENVGFADACVHGVAQARGEFVMLLNNDTEVMSGWIDHLVAEMDDHPDTGVVGSMIVRPDLCLQEAGSIMLKDGRGWQYGLGDTPLDWRYRTRREVDYCSGASCLVRRTVWDEVDGFDARFRPAYYEDADLCFAARDAGYDVVYEPRSVVLHNEGSSHGTDSSGTKRYQFRNRARFTEKWAAQLVAHGTAEDASDASSIIGLRDRRRIGHVIVVDHRVLTPDQDAGSLRMMRLIEQLMTLGKIVHFLPMDNTRMEPWTSRMEHAGVEFITGSRADISRHVRALSGMLDFILMSRPEVGAKSLSLLLEHATTVPIVYDMVDAHGQRYRRSAALQGRPELVSDAVYFERLEAAMASVADVVVTVSEADERFICSVARAPLRTVRIPTIHYSQPGEPGFHAREGLLFVGGFEHQPNVDAVLYLVHELLPGIRSRIGDVRLTIAGSKPPREFTRLSAHNVVVAGWVPDLEPLYGRARLVTAPIRYGAGVKGKIGEALGHGVPTITTSIGVEGMPFEVGRDILVADDAASYVDLVVEAYTSEARWTGLREAGLAAVESAFGAAATKARVTTLLAEVASVDVRLKPPTSASERTAQLDGQV